jgi:uncharacterized protein
VRCVVRPPRNTLATLAIRESRQPPLMQGIEVTQVGVAALLDLTERNWTVVRP